MRRRTLPIGGWLAIAVVLAVALPAGGGAAAWLVVDHREQGDVDRRASAAAGVIRAAAATGDPLALKRALDRPLNALRVEAELDVVPTVFAGRDKAPAGSGVPGEAAARAAKEAMVKPAGLAISPGLAATLNRPDGKSALSSKYAVRTFDTGIVAGRLYVVRPGASTRVAAAAVSALLLLAAVLALAVVLLRRWVVGPLARLAADADRIAGGTLDVSPVRSRTREVDDVAAALRGMADGLGRALAEQDAAEQQRRFLVSAVAHDLRTPLFTLRGSLQALEHGIGGDDQLQRAQDKATLLDRLVGDLFTFSRLEYAEPELVLEDLDAAALARDAADLVDPRITVIAPGHPVRVRGDAALLMRMLLNLLDNAVRYARTTVELRVGQHAGEVTFDVLDDGPGLEPADLPHLFEPLFRGDRARNSATGGAGLGLAIVQRLAAAHGASVHAGNRPAGGARFTVRVPSVRDSAAVSAARPAQSA